MLRALPIVLLAALSACGSADASHPHVEGLRPTHVARSAPDDPLLSYAWNGGPSIPAGRVAAEQRIEYGELGVDAYTRAYLPLNEGTGDEVFDVADPERELTLKGAEWTEGRFGGALRFARGTTSLELGEGSRKLLARPFALSFWIRPDQTKRDAYAPIIQGGPFKVGLLKDGRCQLDVAAEPPLVLRSEPLQGGQWNHVAVAVDGPELAQVRLVVNAKLSSNKLGELEKGLDRVSIAGFAGALDELHVSSVATSTGDLEARFHETLTPGMHTLELEYESGPREVALWSGVLAQPELETAADWGSGRLRHVVHDGSALRRVPGHWERIHAPHPPVARTTHPTVYVGDQRVFIFGGETRDTHAWVWGCTNDTWIFHTGEGRWERIESEAAPEPACHQAAAYSPDHGIVLYPGGWRNDLEEPIHYNSTWVFVPGEGRWQKLEPKGQKIPNMANCGVVYHPGKRKFFVFSGAPRRIFTFDPEKVAWKRLGKYESVTTAGEPAEYGTTGSPMVAYDPATEKILFFGGATGHKETKRFWNETAIYDPDENRFTVLDLDLKPEPRVRAGFAHDSKRGHFVMFGGVLDQWSDRFDDLWLFDPVAREWREMEASNPPTARGGYYGMAYDPDLDRFFLLCGRQAKERFLDEAWSLHLDEGATGEATYVFDRSSFPGRTSWYAEVRAQGDARADFRFRGSSDLGTWSEWSEDPATVLATEARYVQVELTLKPGTDGAEAEVLSMGFR